MCVQLRHEWPCPSELRTSLFSPFGKRTHVQNKSGTRALLLSSQWYFFVVCSCSVWEIRLDFSPKIRLRPQSTHLPQNKSRWGFWGSHTLLTLVSPNTIEGKSKCQFTRRRPFLDAFLSSPVLISHFLAFISFFLFEKGVVWSGKQCYVFCIAVSFFDPHSKNTFKIFFLFLASFGKMRAVGDLGAWSSLVQFGALYRT